MAEPHKFHNLCTKRVVEENIIKKLLHREDAMLDVKQNADGSILLRMLPIYHIEQVCEEEYCATIKSVDAQKCLAKLDSYATIYLANNNPRKKILRQGTFEYVTYNDVVEHLNHCPNALLYQSLTGKTIVEELAKIKFDESALNDLQMAYLCLLPNVIKRVLICKKAYGFKPKLKSGYTEEDYMSAYKRLCDFIEEDLSYSANYLARIHGEGFEYCLSLESIREILYLLTDYALQVFDLCQQTLEKSEHDIDALASHEASSRFDDDRSDYPDWLGGVMSESAFWESV